MSPAAKRLAAAIVVLGLLALAYQRLHRADFSRPEMRGAGFPSRDDPPPAPGRLPVSGQKEGVDSTGRMRTDREERPPFPSVPPVPSAP